jgi:hypothetical protein
MVDDASSEVEENTTKSVSSKSTITLSTSTLSSIDTNLSTPLPSVVSNSSNFGGTGVNLSLPSSQESVNVFAGFRHPLLSDGLPSSSNDDQKNSANSVAQEATVRDHNFYISEQKLTLPTNKVADFAPAIESEKHRRISHNHSFNEDDDEDFETESETRLLFSQTRAFSSKVML